MKMFTDNCSKPLSGGASAGQTRHPRDYAFSIPFIATSRYPAATRLHLYLSVSSFLSFYLFHLIPSPVPSCPRRLVFQTRRWTAALDSIALKCIFIKFFLSVKE
ncbi:hypothetical protein AAAT70_17475 [Phocaeicola vulgatus]|uniref:hypothetical protein n=1 Tax=Phocaeicola vulgatus TaxID=821 RepID=UPI0032BF243D